MHAEKSICKTALKKNIIGKDIFKRELDLRKQLSN